MEPFENILSRKSVRTYSDRTISDELIEKILTAGMSGPSAVNKRPFEFLISTDRVVLNKMAEANGPYATPLKSAALGILVVGDISKDYLGEFGYWIIDCSIACQNIILAANSFGIGSVWLGTYPEMDRVKRLKETFSLPENIVPHSLIALGYPKKDSMQIRNLYEPQKVHRDHW